MLTILAKTILQNAGCSVCIFITVYLIHIFVIVIDIRYQNVNGLTSAKTNIS